MDDHGSLIDFNNNGSILVVAFVAVIYVYGMSSGEHKILCFNT